MFRALPCSSSGGQIVLLQHLVSSLCKRLYSTPVESGLQSTLNWRTVQPFTESDDTRYCNNKTDLLKISMVMLETFRGL